MSDAVRMNEWESLKFLDPEQVLRALRKLELSEPIAHSPDYVRSLRTNRQKSFRDDIAVDMRSFRDRAVDLGCRRRVVDAHVHERESNLSS